MRILHLVPFTIPASVGGAYSRFYSIARPLQSVVEGYSVFAVPTHRQGMDTSQPTADWQDFTLLGVSPINHVSVLQPDGILGSLYTAARQLDRAVTTFRPSLLLIHNVSVNVVIPSLFQKLKTKVPIVIDYEDIGRAFLTRTLVADTLERIACKEANLVIATSGYLENRARALGCKNVFYLPPLVDTFSFKPSQPDQQLREGLRLGRSPVIIFVGYSWELKGVDLLLQALTLIVPEFPEVILLLIGGDKAERNQFSGLVHELHLERNVVMTGPVDYKEIPRLIGQADLAVVPFKDHTANRAAGPTKVAEYLACGKPVIATDVGDLPRLIQHRVTGLIAEPKAENLAMSIRKLMGDLSLRETMSRNARKFAEENFDMWTRSPELLNVLLNIVEEN